jgi:hypothetical protein
VNIAVSLFSPIRISHLGAILQARFKVCAVTEYRTIANYQFRFTEDSMKIVRSGIIGILEKFKKKGLGLLECFHVACQDPSGVCRITHGDGAQALLANDLRTRT